MMNEWPEYTRCILKYITLLSMRCYCLRIHVVASVNTSFTLSNKLLNLLIIQTQSIII